VTPPRKPTDTLTKLQTIARRPANAKAPVEGISGSNELLKQTIEHLYYYTCTLATEHRVQPIDLIRAIAKKTELPL
jgi:hypothetical protein